MRYEEDCLFLHAKYYSEAHSTHLEAMTALFLPRISEIFQPTLIFKYYEENLTSPFGKHLHACRVG